MDRRPRNGSAIMDALSEVRGIYAKLAARPILRNCTGIAECCQFKLTGLTPYLTKGEALIAAKAWRATGRKKLLQKDDGSCPMLDPTTWRCLIYNDRPFGCRTHFCAAAGGAWARNEVVDLIHDLEIIDAKLGGNGPRKITGAVSDALDEFR